MRSTLLDIRILRPFGKTGPPTSLYTFFGDFHRIDQNIKETFEKLRPALTGSVLVDWDSFKGRTKPDAVEELPIIAKAD